MARWPPTHYPKMANPHRHDEVADQYGHHEGLNKTTTKTGTIRWPTRRIAMSQGGRSGGQNGCRVQHGRYNAGGLARWPPLTSY